MTKTRIANHSGMSIKDAQDNVAVTEALYNIEDTSNFLKYFIKHRDSIMCYGKEDKRVRLLTLSKKYKETENQKKLPYELADNFCSELVKKLELVRIIVKNKIEEGEFKWENFKENKPFDKSDLAAIKGLKKSPSAIIMMIESRSIKDELVKLFMQEYIRKSKYKALGNNEKEVLKLAINVREG